MWFRSATRPFVATAVLCAILGAMLGGCSDIYYDRRDTISLASGEAMAANRVTHTIDPWPAHASKRTIAYNGEKAAVASERYRTGRVIPPVNATTSSAAYGQAPSAPAGGGNSPTK